MDYFLRGLFIGGEGVEMIYLGVDLAVGGGDLLHAGVFVAPGLRGNVVG